MLESADLQEYTKKLEKANYVIKEIASEYKNITPIVPSDCLLFDEFFSREIKHTYGNSWIYITQGTFGIGPENLGYKYYDGENLCALSIYPKIEQPDILMLYWIRPLGKGILPIISKIAEEIKQKFAICCYVKKLFPEQYEFLLQQGFKSAKEFPWHSTTHSEDDTFPELIFDREKTVDSISCAVSRSKLGSAVRKTSKLARESVIETDSNDFQQNAWMIVNTYFDRYRKFAKGVNISTPFDYYNMIFCEYNSSNIEVERKIILVNKQPAGFFVLMRDKKIDLTNLYACFALREYYKYLADYFFIRMFEYEPTSFINVGGSEIDGINDFKQKYQPIEKNSMYWVTNYSS